MRSIVFDSESWSPDGNTIAFGMVTDEGHFRNDLFTVQVSDGSMQRITNYGWSEVNKTAWLKDGSGLMLIAGEKESHPSVSHSQIWHVGFPGGEVHKLTADLSSYRAVLNLSDDSLLTTELRQMNNIWIAPADNLGDAKQVTFGSFGIRDRSSQTVKRRSSGLRIQSLSTQLGLGSLRNSAWPEIP